MVSVATQVRPLSDRRFFTWMSVAMAAMTFAGFARTYFLAGLNDGPRPVLTPIVHLHGALATAWILLLIVQTRLIAYGRRDIHKLLGFAGVGDRRERHCGRTLGRDPQRAARSHAGDRGHVGRSVRLPGHAFLQRGPVRTVRDAGRAQQAALGSSQALHDARHPQHDRPGHGAYRHSDNAGRSARRSRCDGARECVPDRDGHSRLLHAREAPSRHAVGRSHHAAIGAVAILRSATARHFRHSRACSWAERAAPSGCATAPPRRARPAVRPGRSPGTSSGPDTADCGS